MLSRAEESRLSGIPVDEIRASHFHGDFVLIDDVHGQRHRIDLTAPAQLPFLDAADEPEPETAAPQRAEDAPDDTEAAQGEAADAPQTDPSDGDATPVEDDPQQAPGLSEGDVVAQLRAAVPELSTRAAKALYQAGYFSLDQIADATRDELLAINGVAEGSVQLIEAALRAKGV